MLLALERSGIDRMSDWLQSAPAGHKVISKSCTPTLGIQRSRKFMASNVGPSMCTGKFVASVF